MANNETINVLILDDEKAISEGLSFFITTIPGLVPKVAALPSEAYEILKKDIIDIAIIDIKLPQESGIEVLKKIKAMYPNIEILMISGFGDMDTVVECLRCGAFDYFTKPFDLVLIKNAIERTKKIVEIKGKLNTAKAQIKNLEKIVHNQSKNIIIGSSKEINRVKSLIENVAFTDTTTVLISGETGTGKELVAKQIHTLSDRCVQSFSAYNCSAIPDHLFESEFFGYNKGAFTGASHDKKGWFEIAHKGTLFLDEIGDMPMFLQSKLLRILEDRKVTRLGATKSIDIDVRIISATNKNIDELIEKGKFREDLYYRLNTFEIKIPPLRERKDDIVELSYLFMKEFAEKFNKKITDIDESALSLLLSYNFPGNVRQLKNFIERAVILCKGNILKVEYFTETSIDYFENQNLSESNTIKNYDLEVNERNLIITVLNQTNYNKTKASKLLNITMQSLIRRMQKYNL